MMMMIFFILAAISRIVLFGFGLLLNWGLDDYDTSTSILIDRTHHLTCSLASPWLKWDAVYFSHIASTGGYEVEQTHAFYPGFPWLIRLISTLVFQDTTMCQVAAIGVVLNCLVFSFTTVVLYQLSLRVLRNERLSLLSCVLWIINPANVFFMAPYSESMFACLGFSMMLLVVKKKYWLASAVAGMASLVRSNGIVLAGFILYSSIARRKIRIGAVIASILQMLLCCSGHICYQVYSYFKFCSKDDPPWCHESLLPSHYTHVQSVYWNVGFLRYYRLSQVPNFALAGPVLSISAIAAFRYFRSNPKLMPFGWINMREKESSTFYGVNVLPFVTHWLVLSITAVLFMHIQVTTRFLASSTPAMYWFCAQVISDNHQTKLAFFILCFFVTFNLVGHVLFTNFMPWT